MYRQGKGHISVRTTKLPWRVRLRLIWMLLKEHRFELSCGIESVTWEPTFEHDVTLGGEQI